MRHDDYAEHVLDFTQEMKQVTESKNHDYSVNDDAMSNFKEIAALLGISPRVVWAVLWMKHVTAICNHMAQGKKLKSESIHGRFIDNANYSVLGDALDKDLELEANSSLPEKATVEVLTLDDVIEFMEGEFASITENDQTSCVRRQRLKPILHELHYMKRARDDQHGSQTADRPLQRNPGDVRDASPSNGAVAEPRHEPDDGSHLRGVTSGN